MPGTSPEGWPYILDTDHPIEYPAYSQSLANLMDSRWDTWQSTSLLVPVAPWADYGNGYTLGITKSGGMVTICAALKPTSNVPLTGSGSVQIATIPAGGGWRPASNVMSTSAVYTGTATDFLRLLIDGGGAVKIAAYASITITTSGYVGVVATYRGS